MHGYAGWSTQRPMLVTARIWPAKAKEKRCIPSIPRVPYCMDQSGLVRVSSTHLPNRSSFSPDHDLGSPHAYITQVPGLA